MKYYIQRQLNEYGPYTLADLQRYVAQGSILLTDLTRSEGMTDWVPVSQVIGNIPIPAPAPAMQNPGYGGAPTYDSTGSTGAGTVYGGPGTVYGGPGTVYGGAGTAYGSALAMPMEAGLVPPDFHWALVLLIGCFCGLFQLVWLFVEASFVQKIDRESRCTAFLIGGIATQVVGFVVLFATAASGNDPTLAGSLFWLFLLAGAALQLVGIFKMRTSLEEYYNTVEPIHLHLSGVMTFFFGVYYFQYHFSRIANWKKTGYLQPQ